MIKFRKPLVTMLIVVIVALSGCGFVEDNSNIIQSPQSENEAHEQLKEVLNTLLSSDIEYVTPKNTQQKQSIYIDDIDQDSKKEAFVFYKEKEENRQVRLLVLQNDGQEWNKLSDEPTGYNTLEYFEVVDLDENGIKEVIVGVGFGQWDSNKQLYIYEWDNNDLSKTVDRNYRGIDIADYTEDNKVDIILLESNEIKTAQLLNYEKGELVSMSTVELESSILHENIVSGSLLDGKRALFIDSGLGAHSMLTEIVAYNNGELIKFGDMNDRFLLKAYPAYSKDINNDGVVEAVGLYIPKGWEEASFSEIPFIRVYASYSIDGKRQTVEERYVNGRKNFYITIPPTLYGSVTVEMIDDGVRLLSDTDKEVLFEVKWTDKESFDNSKIKLEETKDTIFYTDLKGNRNIHHGNFHLFEDDF